MSPNRSSLNRAVATNLSLAGVFLAALVFPLQNLHFIGREAPMILVIEFLSIHSLIMPSIFQGVLYSPIRRDWAKPAPREFVWFDMLLRLLDMLGRILTSVVFRLFALFLLAFYALVTILLFINFQTPFGPLFFFVSVLGKFFGKRAVRQPHHPLMLFGLWFGTAVLAISTAPLWRILYPFPEEFFSTSGKIGGGGIFFEDPQAALMWGVFYYSLVAALETALFKRIKSPSTIS